MAVQFSILCNELLISAINFYENVSKQTKTEMSENKEKINLMIMQIEINKREFCRETENRKVLMKQFSWLQLERVFYLYIYMCVCA